MPKSGRLVRTNGRIAQCIAQATEAPIPNASQFIFIPMKKAKVIKCNNVANFKTILHMIMPYLLYMSVNFVD